MVDASTTSSDINHQHTVFTHRSPSLIAARPCIQSSLRSPPPLFTRLLDIYRVHAGINPSSPCLEATSHSLKVNAISETQYGSLNTHLFFPFTQIQHVYFADISTANPSAPARNRFTSFAIQAPNPLTHNDNNDLGRTAPLPASIRPPFPQSPPSTSSFASPKCHPALRHPRLPRALALSPLSVDLTPIPSTLHPPKPLPSSPSSSATATSSIAPLGPKRTLPSS